MEKFSILNFKRFDKLEISIPLSGQLVIFGPNGSGKTQLLWAFVLYFRGHNHLLNGGIAKKGFGNELGCLLNRLEFKGLTSFASFLHKAPGDDGDHANFTATYSEAMDPVEVKLWANGALELFHGQQLNHHQILYYAFMGSEFHFHAIEFARSNQTPLTSSSRCIRQFYYELRDESKEYIKDCMKELFGIDRIYGDKDEDLLKVAQKGYEMEVQFLGSAMQKALCTLVLACTLCEKKDGLKFFLIEGPEALLYPSLNHNFVSIIQSFCR